MAGFPDSPPTTIPCLAPWDRSQGPESSMSLFLGAYFPCFEFPSPTPPICLISPVDNFRGKVAFDGLLRHKHFHICYFHILLTTLVHMSWSLRRHRCRGRLSIEGESALGMQGTGRPTA